MMTRVVDPLEQQAGVAPSTIWAGSSGDFAVAPANDARNPQGLSGDAAILSALALCLFSDGKGDPDPIDPAAIDLRGWPGDGFDVDRAAGEAPLGNKVWTLFRLPVNDENARTAERYMIEALSCLIGQGVLGSAEVKATPYPSQRRVDLVYILRRPNGTTLYSGPWAGLWETMQGVV